MRIYVDVDGTILDRSLDEEFIRRCGEDGIGDTYMWYVSQKVTTLRRRWWLLIALTVLWVLGVELIVWTNRFDVNRSATQRNLGWFWGIFKEHQFWCSTKATCIPTDGWVLDNEPKYTRHSKGICIPHYRVG